MGAQNYPGCRNMIVKPVYRYMYVELLEDKLIISEYMYYDLSMPI